MDTPHFPEASDRSDPLKHYVGRRVAHYQVIELLGGGGMGVVYKARDTRLDRTVALKFLPPLLIRDERAKARFIREARAASSLDHPNICTIYEIGETPEGLSYIAMAYYAGETLEKRMASGRLPVEDVLSYAIEVAEGLRAAHAAGIVHRDVKPANVMVPDEGPLKLVDFGLAKVAARTQLTQTGSTMGTVAYMSPEQARGEDVDGRTDVWSLGVMVYEMLTGRRPFPGTYPAAVVYSILNETPEPITHPDVPPELARIVRRTMEKDPDRRLGSAAALLDALREVRRSLHSGNRPLDRRSLLHALRTPRIAVPAAGMVLILVLAGAWMLDRRAKVRWARQVALPEIARLVEASWRDFTDAYALAERAERYLPDDPELAALMAKSSLHIDIDSEPQGAEVFMSAYGEPDSWTRVGVTPIDSLRVPVGIFRWRFEKEGFETVDAAASSWDVRVTGPDLLVPSDLTRVLDERGTVPEGVVRVQGAETPAGAIAGFFIDRFEVTNAQYRAFVDAGGYGNPDYWKHEFVKDGAVMTWEEAMSEMVDQTGRPGPATWQAGDYPEGEADHPVSGVSWYEAAAYADFAGKTLPTGTHWGLARGEATPLIRWPQLGGFAAFSPFSNFGGDGPVAAGELAGITSYGAFDMAGNVREWCWNETPGGRLVRGGAWNDNTYRFAELSQAPPFDRSFENGFRTALYLEDPPDAALGPTAFPEETDYSRVAPVPDAVFEAYRAQFSYDPMPLNARVEETDGSEADWTHERISFDAAYEGERMMAHLFLPRNASPPYQTVIYFPGSASLFQGSSDDITSYYEFPVFLSFLIKNGRAVLYPIYKGTFERQELDAVPAFLDPDSHLYTEYLVKWVKDFRRSVDYLETRDDIDPSRLAYYGLSWGGMLGAIIPAVEDRLRTSILAPGVLRARGRPEANQLSYISRVTIPTLMLNGRHDMLAGIDASARPMYELLGTPEEHKELKLFDTDHIPARNDYIRETLAWLDRYLGPVR